jgi:hypothetical protein
VVMGPVGAIVFACGVGYSGVVSVDDVYKEN